MTTLDDAIQAHMAHPAASGFDPLTDSLADQAAPYPLREGWQTEPIAVPMPWLLGLLALLVGCFVLPHLLVDRMAVAGGPVNQTEAAAITASAASGVR